MRSSEDISDIGQKKTCSPFGRRSIKHHLYWGFENYVFMKNQAFLVVMFSTWEYKTHPCITSILKKMYSTRKTDLLGERLNRWIVDSRKAGCHWSKSHVCNPRSECTVKTEIHCTHFQTAGLRMSCTGGMRMLLAWGSPARDLNDLKRTSMSHSMTQWINSWLSFSSQTSIDERKQFLLASFNSMASVPRAFNQWTKQWYTIGSQGTLTSLKAGLTFFL